MPARSARATAQCRDGSYSRSQHSRGMWWSGHRNVTKWRSIR
ncbi:DUF3761 domain-containing protein [Bradyrhizobium diazoefficiens]